MRTRLGSQQMQIPSPYSSEFPSSLFCNMLRLTPRPFSRFFCGSSPRVKVSDNLKDYDVFINPPSRLVDIYMQEHGNSRPDFKRQDIATWQAAWGDRYRFGLIFPKGTDELAFSFHTIQYRSLGYQPDFQHLGMAWIPEKFRGREILKVVTRYLIEEEKMKQKNMLACNVFWSQNFWKQATGNGDIGSCTYYISYYDMEQFQVPNIKEEGISVKEVNKNTISDALAYDKSVFPFSRESFIRGIFDEGIARIAYDSNAKVVGIGCLSTYPSGECVISPLYADNEKVAQLIFMSILKEVLELDEQRRGKDKLWRMQIRSNDQCRSSYEWIEPFLKCQPRRVHLSNLCYSIYPPKHVFDFFKVFVNCHPTNGPC